MPVEMSCLPVPSRSSLIRICVSLVVREISAVRMVAPLQVVIPKSGDFDSEFRFQSTQQRISILRSSHTDADMVTQAGLVEITDEDTVFLGQFCFEFRCVTADDLAQDKV